MPTKRRAGVRVDGRSISAGIRGWYGIVVGWNILDLGD